VTQDSDLAGVAPRWSRFSPRRLLDFERATSRRDAFLLLLAAAIVSPNLPLPGSLPAVRLEQIGLVLLLPSLGLYLWRHPEARRLGPVDVALGLLVAAIALSVAVAPILVPQVGRTYHDVFDVARPVEYWLLYRLARLSPADGPAGRSIITVAAGAAVLSGVLAIAQRFGPEAFNNVVTAIWTGAGHNLAVVVRGGRAVGTVGSPNNFGLLGALLVMLLLAVPLLRVSLGRRAGRWLLAALALGTAGLVLSQSRSAVFGLTGAIVLGLIALAALRVRFDPRPIGAVLVAALVTAGAVILVPASNGSSIVQRFDVATLGSDTSVVVRVARIQSALSRPESDLEAQLVCNGSSPAEIQSGHAPGPFVPVASPAAGGTPTASPSPTGSIGPSPSPTATPPPDLSTAAGRDQQRKADVTAIATEIQDVFCASHTWPADLSQVYTGGAAPPVDPSTGKPYTVELNSHGYQVSATLESPGDPQGPVYTLGSSPDLVQDPSFESGGTAWQAGPGTDLLIVPGGRFGAAAGQITDAPAAQIHQYVMYAFAPGTTYVAQAWARATAGTPSGATIELIGWTTDGGVIAPLAEASVDLPADGRWTPVHVTFTTPTGGSVWVVQLLLVPRHGAGPVDVDGVSLTLGSLPPSFGPLREVDPALLPSDAPSVWDSPVIGLGSLSTFDIGAFDDAYAYVFVHYGALGLLCYLLLFVVLLIELARRWFAVRSGLPAALIVAMAIFTVAMLAFDIAAASFFSYQLMAIYWLVMGSVLGMSGAAFPAWLERRLASRRRA
jgi:hypothetical protein